MVPRQSPFVPGMSAPAAPVWYPQPQPPQPPVQLPAPPMAHVAPLIEQGAYLVAMLTPSQQALLYSVRAVSKRVTSRAYVPEPQEMADFVILQQMQLVTPEQGGYSITPMGQAAIAADGIQFLITLYAR